jgi:hypothetical protein
MRFLALLVVGLTLSSFAYGASPAGTSSSSTGSSGAGSAGSSAAGRTGAGTPTRSFGALPGAPGSSSYNPQAGLPNGGFTGSPQGALGALPGSPGSPNYNPNSALPSLNSPPTPTIPSLDSVMPGASTSGLLPQSGSASNP